MTYKNENDDKGDVLGQLNWSIEPDRDLWPDIQAKLEARSAPASSTSLELQTQAKGEVVQMPLRFGGQKPWLAVSMAACMMLALGAFIMSSMSFQRAQDTYELQASYIEFQKSQISLIEQQHSQVRAQFTALLNGDLGTIDSTTVAEIEMVLLTIDNASLELKQAILAQPTNSSHAAKLARTYKEELKLLNKFKTANGISI